MSGLFRLCLLACIAFKFAIADQSTDSIGVRVVLNRGNHDETFCTAEERTTIGDIVELTLASHYRHGRIRAASTRVSQSCIELCEGYQPGTCFFAGAHCHENTGATVATPGDEKEATTPKLSQAEMQTLCRARKRQVIAELRSEVASRDLSGQCKAFVGGSVEVACHLRV